MAMQRNNKMFLNQVKIPTRSTLFKQILMVISLLTLTVVAMSYCYGIEIGGLLSINYRKMPLLLRRSQDFDSSDEDMEIKDKDAWLASKEAEYSKLQLKMKQVCSGNLAKSNEGLWSTRPSFFIQDPKLRMAFCRHAKVGTSTWFTYFVRLSQSIPEAMKQKMLSDIFVLHYSGYPYLQLKKDSSMFKDINEHKNVFLFSFVRHPFERLVSAYWDKLYLLRDPGFTAMAQKLMASTNTSWVTFESFLQLVAQQPKGNNHWTPYYEACAYCALDFDFIGKLESFEEDVEYIFTKMNLTHRLELGVHWNNSKDKKAVRKGTKSARAEKLFANVTSETMQKLCKVYQLDFLMFNYNMSDYC